MLQEDGCRKRVDVPLATTGGPAQVANGTECQGGGIPLVHETHGTAGPFLQLGGDVADFDSTGRIVAVRVEWQADNVACDLERLTTPNHFGNGRSLTTPTLDVAGRRCNRAGWIAHRQADSAVTVVDRQKASRESGIRNRE